MLQWLKHVFVSPSEKAKTDVLKGKIDIHGIAQGIKQGRFKNIIVLTGAGISVSAGIPDFRSRTGMYERSTKFKLPHPWAVFDANYFKRNPIPFYDIVRNMMFAKGSGSEMTYRPTLTHCFFALLERKNLLTRVYTQNVDCLETVSGLSPKRLCQMHGTVQTARCCKCKKAQPISAMAETLKPLPDDDPAVAANTSPFKWREDGLTWSVPMCPHCQSDDAIIKPDVVLFNEGLPVENLMQSTVDMPQCDLLLCFGSTFQVMPFATFIGKVDDLTPRVLFNREKVAQDDNSPLKAEVRFQFDSPSNYRDVFVEGDCDDTVVALCEELGWIDELRALHVEAGTVSLSALASRDPNRVA